MMDPIKIRCELTRLVLSKINMDLTNPDTISLIKTIVDDLYANIIDY